MIDVLKAMKAVTELTGALVELVTELRAHRKTVDAHTAQLARLSERQ